MSEQKFHKGDLVHIAKDQGSGRRYFTGDCDAIIEYSYADKYGGSDTKSYGVYLKGKGECAWYPEHCMTLIESNRFDLLESWRKERDDDIRQKRDLDWIFEHGLEVLDKMYGASCEALAACWGCTNLWGSRGEGFVYWENAMTTLCLALPFLEKGDKQGWLDFCKDRLAKKETENK